MRRYLVTVSALCLGLSLLSAPVAAQYAPLSPEYSVRNVQQALNMLGYNAGTPDGVMGSRTSGAIGAYQRDNGLPVTGQPSAVLYDRLLASAANRGGPTPPPAPPPSYQEAQFSRDLVTAVQSELRQRGYPIPSITGELDGETRNAILQYQTDAGLTVTGQPSETLLSHLRTANVQRGGVDRRQLVAAIQQELNRRGYDAGPADGALGPKSQSAIRTYQSDAGMPVTGEPSETLLASLRRAGDRPGRPPFGRPGAPQAEEEFDRGLVRDIQQELRQRRLYGERSTVA